MTENERPQFATMIVALAETFRTEATDGLMLGFWLGLRDLDLAHVAAGVEAALREAVFMPAPAEVREWAEIARRDAETRRAEEEAAALAAARERCPDCCKPTRRACPAHGGTIACRACRWAYPALCPEHRKSQAAALDLAKRLGERMDPRTLGPAEADIEADSVPF